MTGAEVSAAVGMGLAFKKNGGLGMTPSQLLGQLLVPLLLMALKAIEEKEVTSALINVDWRSWRCWSFCNSRGDGISPRELRLKALEWLPLQLLVQ